MPDTPQKQAQTAKTELSGAGKEPGKTHPVARPEPPIRGWQCSLGNRAMGLLLEANLGALGHAEPAEQPFARENTATSHRGFTHNLASIPVSHTSVRGIQRKLTVNEPGDAYEQEADRVAEQVMHMPAPQSAAANTTFGASAGSAAGIQRACACGGTCEDCKKKSHDEHAKVQMKAAGPISAGGIEAPPIVHEVLRSSGQPLDAPTRAFMEPRFGQDFSGVRVHTDAKAVESAQAVNAKAYTAGNNVIFGAGEYAPGSREGQKLLGHELMHVVQQGQTATPNAVQRSIIPENVSSEMVGQEFSLRKDFSASGNTLPAGTGVTVVSWSNTAETVEVRHPAVSGTFNIPKVLLEPKQTSVPGIAPYGTDLKKYEKIAESHGAKLEAFKKTPPKERMKDFATDLVQREADQAKVEKIVNTRLIQGSMLNRFDASIKKWVDFYNTQFGLKGKDALDPNLVKAMMYKESSMGTNEPFMNDPPTHPIMSRFNLLQAVDSPINDIVPIMREMAPSLFAKYHIEHIETDLMAVEVEFDKLNGKSRNATEEARFTTLSGQHDNGNWKPWFFTRPGFDDAVREFLATVDGGKKHSEDYDFWIRDGIRALFSKRTEVKAKTWEETVRHYNPAESYFKFVERHRSGALAAKKDKKEFIPENL